MNVSFRIVISTMLLACSAHVTAQTSDKSSVMEKGKLVYDQNCLACHQMDGSGVPMLTPSLVNAAYVNGDKIRLINVVLKGLKGVAIDGEMYDSPMPPLAHLSDDDIAAVLTYVRGNFSNKSGEIKREEVAEVRKTGK